jgi:hypothetical protein
MALFDADLSIAAAADGTAATWSSSDLLAAPWSGAVASL